MPKIKDNNKKNKKDTKYNADNEIIIGVTTKPKNKVRVENKKATRTNTKSNKANHKKLNKSKTKKIKSTQKVNEEIAKQKQIKKLNTKKIIFSIIAILFMAICGTIYYLTTPVFNVANIIVYGNNKNSQDTYISLSGISINQTNIFAFTNNTIERRIKENPYVESVKIEKKFPNVVELHITERIVDYKVSYLNSYIYLNNQGYILEINEEENNALLIKGLNLIEEEIKIGQRVSKENLIKLDTVLKVTNYIKYNNVKKQLTKIDVTDEKNYILEFAKEDKIAYIGDSSSITEKMTSVIKVLESEEGKKGKIFANEEVLKKNRVYFSEEEKED